MAAPVLSTSRVSEFVAGFRESTRQLAVQELECRYSLAVLAQALRSIPRDGGGMRPLAAAAALLQLDESALRRMAAVAEAIPEQEFQWLIRLGQTAAGESLTWSHIEALASVTVRAARRELAAVVASERLSAKDLTSRIRATRRRAGAAPLNR